MKSIRELAQIFEGMFEERTRESGSKFFTVKDNVDPVMGEHLKGVIFAAHDGGGIMPDDYRYEFIWRSIVAISEHDNIDYAEQDATEPDVCNFDLTAWLHSRNDRIEYLTRALEEFGPITDGWKALSTAQYLEKSDVFQAVLAALEEIEIEDEEETQC